DIEPQTGMLARAYKRIQVNYQLFNTHLPELDQATVDLATYACGNLTTLGQFLPVPECGTILPLNLIYCLNSPSTWTFNQGSVMI
ncbi:hypothetical protein ABTD95_19785, partial [Acinetobacter baumannii]